MLTRLKIVPLESPVPPMSDPPTDTLFSVPPLSDLSQKIGAITAKNVAVNIDLAHVATAKDRPAGVTCAAEERAIHGHARQRAVAEDFARTSASAPLTSP